MKRSMATLCLSGELDARLEAIARAEFGGVEIFVDDLDGSVLTAREIGERCRDLGLSVVALQPFRDAEGLPAPAHRQKLEAARRQFETLATLGGDFLLLCSNTREDASEASDDIAASLHDFAALATEHGMRIGYEALAWGRHVDDYREAWRLVRLVDHPALSVVLDSYHVLARDLDLQTLADIPAERIGLVQLADAPRPPANADRHALQSLSRHRRAFPGQGELAIGAFLEAVGRTGYAGPISLEIFSDILGVMPTGMSALEGKRTLDEALAERP
ncbi:sugar phosphate isomerase/epimerase family protein [Salinicola avicenniae]|uniref:sugar phosphate isomerase/epimerase family protein n=1 Tax=Salinicola avicenniae TaxID=2916836 RepID=UPI0020740B68|nr:MULTISPECIES: sugar phosphate isomerase/epimerase family protein [unclassified Salinicola]